MASLCAASLFLGLSRSFGASITSVKLFASLVPVLLGRNLRIEVWEQEPGSNTRWRIRCAASPGNVEALLADISVGEIQQHHASTVFSHVHTSRNSGRSWFGLLEIDGHKHASVATRVYAGSTLSFPCLQDLLLLLLASAGFVVHCVSNARVTSTGVVFALCFNVVDLPFSIVNPML